MVWNIGRWIVLEDNKRVSAHHRLLSDSPWFFVVHSETMAFEGVSVWQAPAREREEQSGSMCLDTASSNIARLASTMSRTSESLKFRGPSTESAELDVGCVPVIAVPLSKMQIPLMYPTQDISNTFRPSSGLVSW